MAGSLFFDRKLVHNPAGRKNVGNPYTFDAYVNQIYYRMKSGRKDVQFVNENYPIAPGESVVVEAEAPGYVIFTNTEQPWTASAGNGTLNIALSQVVEPGETPDRNGDGPSTGSGTLVLDKAVVSFDEGMRLGKFYFGTQDANIYIPQGGKDYAIAFAEEKAGEMPLNFKANKNGTYTLSFTTDVISFTYLHLIDNMTGADIDLLTPPACGHPL